MKKLFALLVVAGMVFISCGNQPEAVEAETPEVVDEQVVADEQPAADMATEEATETAEETPAE